MGMNGKKSARTIAPRLADGRSRVALYGRLPEPVKYGLRKIARSEGQSMSWVIEQVVIDYFDMSRPVYVGVSKKRTK